MPDDTLEAIRHDFDELASRVKRLEALQGEQRRSFDAQLNAGFGEMRAAFQVVNKRFDGIDGRFDGLESELRFRFEQLDRLEERMDEIIARLGTSDQRHAEIMAQFEKLQAKPTEN
jgi:chromosome segregation ATPase